MGQMYLRSVRHHHRREPELLNGSSSSGCPRCDNIVVRNRTYGSRDATYPSVRYPVPTYPEGERAAGTRVDHHAEVRP